MMNSIPPPWPVQAVPEVKVCPDCDALAWFEREPVEGNRPVVLVQHDKSCPWAAQNFTDGQFLDDRPDVVVGHGFKR